MAIILEETKLYSSDNTLLELTLVRLFRICQLLEALTAMSCIALSPSG